ncbi:MAG: ATP-binding protein [Pirellulaceae bacterium]|nr:ATP-binding protein [Pirellulaceae bacterium]
MSDYEKLGVFYLGRLHDLSSGTTRPDPLLYDSKDLTTHAVCVGMTGSGKTGLCLSLLEEAAIDGIPAIAIDPKGDLGNLLLTFPQLRPEDFRPWVDPQEATRHGMTADEYAADTARRWRQGLADWDQAPERIDRFRQSADVAIYTPGSSAGLPLTVLRSFAAPVAAVIEDSEALGQRIASSVSGLLALLGISADPLRSREHILLSNLLDRAWRAGRDLDLAGLIREIQKPPFEKVGLMDLESFFPAKERFELAMSLNNLLASPAFASWTQGEPLEIKRLLYTADGRPRLSILSIAHLAESERMFFVTILLSELLTWIRTQPGTSSLRALLYMDEVFGYFPPTANPPSKTPMLTLLKQARAYGLGIVLATQNPVDLDYKGLSNTGTWFLGRLQTERDKARVLEGLEGASAAAGANFDRSQMEATLAGLGKRVFLMNNVHEDQPVVFESRWALSYLRGPLTRAQIQTLMQSRKAAAEQAPVAATGAATGAATATLRPETDGVTNSSSSDAPPLAPPEIETRYVRCVPPAGANGRIVYRPALWGEGKLHFVRASSKLDRWEQRGVLAPVHGGLSDDPWQEAQPLAIDRLEWDQRPAEGAQFAELPAALTTARAYKSLAASLKDFFYQQQTLTMFHAASLKQTSEPGESEADFRIRLAQQAKEHRDLEVEKLRKKYATRLSSLQGRIRTAEQRVERERSQAQSHTLQSAINIGSSVLGALLGRKLLSSSTVTRAGTAARSVSRAAEQRADVGRAKDSVESLQQQLADLETELREQVEQLEQSLRADQLELEPLEIRPRKSDLDVRPVVLVWTPWIVDSSGIAQPAWE